MKRHSKFVLYGLALLTMFSGCKKKESEPIPTSFPRKQLIEQFTSQDCTYCPNGTRQIDDVVEGNEKKYVRLNYYYGSNYDNFTVYSTKQLATDMEITSMPCMLYNRSLWEWEDENGVMASGKKMHPYYFSQVATDAATTTTASVNINTVYDAATRNVSIKVSGKNISENKDISLTIIFKESGLHAAQQDQYNTWAGWEDYVHNNVVRNYLNSYKGQVLEFKGTDYEVSLDYNLYKDYTAENSTIVAFLTDNTTGEIINAEETPVVSGTKGGSDFASEGVKAVEVPDTYPETKTLPTEMNNVKFLTAQYYLSGYTVNGHKVVEIMLLSSPYLISGSNYLPTAILYVVVDDDGYTLPTGTFQFSNTGEPNTAWAGERNEAEYSYYGSELYLAKYEYMLEGYIRGYEWLLTSGSLTIEESSITYVATTLSGNVTRGSYSGEIKHFTGEEAPLRRR